MPIYASLICCPVPLVLLKQCGNVNAIRQLRRGTYSCTRLHDERHFQDKNGQHCLGWYFIACRRGISTSLKLPLVNYVFPTRDFIVHLLKCYNVSQCDVASDAQYLPTLKFASHLYRAYFHTPYSFSQSLIDISNALSEFVLTQVHNKLHVSLVHIFITRRNLAR